MDMSTLIGYARVSTAEWSLEMQTDVLKKAEYHQVFTDVASGVKVDRPGLDRAPEHLRDGDTLVMWKVDRLGRPLVYLMQTTDTLRERGVGSRPLTDIRIDTTTHSGRLLFNLFAILAKFEHDLTSERAKASLAVAKARGRSGGRRATVTPEKLAKACGLMDKKGLTAKRAVAALDVGHSALYRASSAECGTPTEGDE